MKTALRKISKRTLSTVLSLLIVLSTLMVGTISANATAKNLTLYCAISSTTLSTYTLKVNSNNNSWTQTNMTYVGNINDDWKLYSANVTTNGDGWLGNLQFQLYDGGTHKGQKEPITSWTDCNSGYDNKVYFYDWEQGWDDVYKVAPFTYNNGNYYLKSDIPSDNEGWNDNTISVTNTSDLKTWDVYLKKNEPDSNGLDIRFWDGPDSKELGPTSNSNGYKTYVSGIKVYDKNGTNRIYNKNTSIRYATSGFDAGKIYKVTVTLVPSTGVVTISNSKLSDMTLSITGTPRKDHSFDLASACSISGAIGTVTKNSYKYSTDGTNYTTISNASAWTPTQSGTYYIKVNATDGGIVPYNSSTHKKDYNAKSARTEDVVGTVNVIYPTHTVSVGSHTNGTLTVNGGASATVGEDEPYSIVATPDDGYKLTNISIGSSSIYNTEQTTATTVSRMMGNDDETVNATFSPRSYNITTGTLSHATVTVANSAAYGSTVNFTVAGETAAYNIDSVTATFTDSSSVSHNVAVSGSNGSYSFTMPAGPVVISASASKTPHNITVTKGTGVESYVVDGTTYTANYTFSISEGDPFTITSVTYSTGYENNNNTLSILSVSQNQTIPLTGKKINYNVTKAAASNGSFTVKKGSSEITTANYGDTIVITPSANQNYEVDTVSYNDGTNHSVSLVGGTYSFTMPAAAVTVTVTFTETMHTVTVLSENTSKGTVASASIQAGNANWVTLPTATAKSGYSFSTWEITSGLGGTLSSATSASAAKIKTTGNIAVTAKFTETMHTVSVQAQTENSIPLGTVTPSSGSGQAGASTALNISASAHPGFAFHSWKSVSGLTYANASSASTSVTASADNKTAIAKFKKTVLYLKVNSDWASDNADFAAYFYKDGANEWQNMTLVPGESDIYRVDIPATYQADSTNVIFCRMNPSRSSNSFDNGTRWNQTGNLDINYATDGKNQYDISGWGSGSWNDTPYFPDEVKDVAVYSGAGGVVKFTQNATTTYTIEAETNRTVKIGLIAKAIKAEPADGYRFSGWTLTGNVTMAGNTASTTVTATGTGSITANFERVSHAINIVSGATFSATASPTSGYYGQNVSISISPNSGYYVTGVTATWAEGSKATQSVTVTGSGNSWSLTIPAYAEDSAINVTVAIEPITPILNVYYADTAKTHTNVTSGNASTCSTESETLSFSNASSYPAGTTFQIIDGTMVLLNSTAGSTTSTGAITLAAGTHTLKVKATLDGVELNSEVVTFKVYDSVNIILQQPAYGGVAKITYTDNYGHANTVKTTEGTYLAAKGESVKVEKNNGAGILYKVNVNGTDYSATGTTDSNKKYSFTINAESTVKALFRSNWELPGSFNSWTGTSNYFVYTDTENVLITEVSLTANSTTGYTFKVFDNSNSTWYSDSGTFTDRTEDINGDPNWWTFMTGDNIGNCTIKTTTAGVYKFKWRTTDNHLKVEMPRKLHNVTYTGDNISNCTHTGNAQEAYKDDVTFTVTPGEDYRIESVKVNGTLTEPDSMVNGVGTYTYEMPDSDITITIDIYRISTLQVFINEGISQIVATITAPNTHVTTHTFTSTETIEVSQGSTVAYVASYVPYWGYNTHNSTDVTMVGSNDHNYSQTIAAGVNTFNLVAKIIWRVKGSFSAPNALKDTTEWNNSWGEDHFFTDNPATAENVEDGKVTLTLAARTTYEFKLFAGEKDGVNDKMYSNSGTIRQDTVGNAMTFSYKINNTVVQNCTLETTVAGNYTFYIDWSDNYNTPKLQIEFPSHTITYKEQVENGTATSTITHLTFDSNNHPVSAKYTVNNSGNANKTITIKVAANDTYKIIGATYTYTAVSGTSTTSNANLTKPTVTTSTSAPYYYTITFTLPRSDVEVNIVYREHNVKNITYTVGNSGAKQGFSADLTDENGTALTQFTIGQTAYITATSRDAYYQVINNNFNSDSSNTIKAKNNTFTNNGDVYRKAFVITAEDPAATVRFTLTPPTVAANQPTQHAMAGKPITASNYFSNTSTTDTTYWITTSQHTGSSDPSSYEGTPSTTGAMTAPATIGTYYVVVKVENKKHTEDNVTFNSGELPAAVYACVELDVSYATKRINVYLDAHGNTLANYAKVSVVDNSGNPVSSDDSGGYYTYNLEQNNAANGSTSLYIKENMLIPDNGEDVKVKVTLAQADNSIASDSITIDYDDYIKDAGENTAACDLWFETTNPQKLELSSVKGSTATTTVNSSKQRIYIKKNKNWSESGNWKDLYIYAWKSGSVHFPSDGFGHAHDSGDNANKFTYIGESGNYHCYYFDLDKSYKDFLIMGYYSSSTYKGQTGDAKIATSNTFILDNKKLTATNNSAVPDITSYYSSVTFNHTDGEQSVKPEYTEGATLTVKTQPNSSLVTYNASTGKITSLGTTGDTSITFTVTGTLGDTREVTTEIHVANSGKPDHIYFMNYESAKTTITIPKVETDTEVYSSPASFSSITTLLKGSQAGTAFSNAGIFSFDNTDSGDKLRTRTATIKYAAATETGPYHNLKLTATVGHIRASEINHRRFGFVAWNNEDNTLYSTKSDEELIVGTNYKLIYEIYQYTEVTVTYNYYTYKTLHDDNFDYNFYDPICLDHEDPNDSDFNNWHNHVSYEVKYEFRGNNLNVDLINNASNLAAQTENLQTVLANGQRNIVNEFYNYTLDPGSLNVTAQDTNAYTLSIETTLIQKPRVYDVRVKSASSSIARVNTVNGTYINPATASEADKKTLLYYQSFLELDYSKLSNLSAAVGLTSGGEYKWNVCQEPWNGASPPTTGFQLLYIGSSYKFRVTTENMFVKVENKGDSTVSNKDSIVSYMGHTLQTTTENGTTSNKLYQNFYLVDHFDADLDTGVVGSSEVKFVGGGGIYYSVDPETGVPLKDDITSQNLATESGGVYSLNKEKVEGIILNSIMQGETDSGKLRQKFGTELPRQAYKINDISTGLVFKFTPFEKYDSTSKKYTKNTNVFRYSRVLGGYQYIYSLGMENDVKNRNKDLQFFSYYIYSYVTHTEDEAITNYAVVISDNSYQVPTYVDPSTN